VEILIRTIPLSTVDVSAILAYQFNPLGQLMRNWIDWASIKCYTYLDNTIFHSNTHILKAFGPMDACLTWGKVNFSIFNVSSLMMLASSSLRSTRPFVTRSSTMTCYLLKSMNLIFYRLLIFFHWLTCSDTNDFRLTFPCLSFSHNPYSSGGQRKSASELLLSSCRVFQLQNININSRRIIE